MEPTTTPPWRVLDAPNTAGTGSAAGGPDGPGGTTVGSTPVKVLAIAGGAVVCAIAAFLLAFGGGGGYVEVDGAATSRVPGDSGDPRAVLEGAPASSRTLVVEIVGAVLRPGVYRLPDGSRVGDLVAAAGGYGLRVDTVQAERALNLAGPLRDGDQVRVPARGDASSGAASTEPTGGGNTGAPLDLNRATQAELEGLPGVGPATALKIIAAREEAPFGAVEELRSRGILGEKTYAKVLDLVAVR